MASTTYRIVNILGGLDTSVCPPAIVSALWPSFDGWPVILSESECIVTVPAGTPPPADLGPLVQVAEVPAT
jgi:hypothetical protein